MRCVAKFGHKGFERFDDGCFVAGFEESLEFIEEFLALKLGRFCDEDRLVFGFLFCSFEEELFIELLSGTQTDKLYGHLFVVESHHLFGKIDDSYRLAHIEDKDLFAFGDGSRLQDQLARFGDEHKVAGDFGMGYGYWLVVENLGSKLWDDATAATKDIAEANGTYGGVRALDVLGIELADPLGRSHNIGRVDRFIGRDEHEVGDSMGDSRVDGVDGAKNIVFNGRFWVELG